ncbi:hypothetical protein Sango_0496100 [Sesamum angolense]|uniref:dCTP pyrophosphatase 1 n=1 Tax=Sesamum angolense TaxID=2727404 RepID=A0AAE1XC10_9LAMI|nr:hypothetical protein Sango_0496100 [Sesamum angolense]
MTGAKQAGGGEEPVTLDLLKRKMDDFTKERDWEKKDFNYVLSTESNTANCEVFSFTIVFPKQVGEVGELSEIFQWKGEVPKGLPDWKEEEKVHLGEELSDVLLYLVRLSDVCGIDLDKAALRKIELNALKYPVKESSNRCNSTDDPSAAA